MLKKWNKLKMAGVFFMLLVFAVIGRTEPVKAATAEKIELNQDYLVQLVKDDDSRLYEFTVPEAGNITVQVKNTNPVGNEKVEVQLFDSNNAALTDTWIDSNVELPVYSTDKNRTFYLTLSKWMGYADYTLTVNFQPTTNWETEDNDTTVSADLITAGKKWYGTITEMDSKDYFKFKLNANKKVTITFGPGEVSGQSNQWEVYLINSNNESKSIYYQDSTTQTYTCYLKKGTYYLQVEKYWASNPNIVYTLSYKESALKLVQPTVSSITATGYESFWGNYVMLNKIKIKNSGDATGYAVKVSNKKTMGKPNIVEEIAIEGTNTKKQVSLQTHFAVNKNYYVQARSYVTDPFGEKMYGKYGAVKGKTLKNSLYKKLTK